MSGNVKQLNPQMSILDNRKQATPEAQKTRVISVKNTHVIHSCCKILR